MRKLLCIIIATIAMTGCGSKKSDPKPPPSNLPPEKAELVFPDQNSVCISGTVISEAINTVQFKWNNAQNADSYDVTVKNLLTGASEMHNTSQTQLDVNLSRNTPYSWSVTSKSNSISATAISDVWKFYNSGSGVVSYAPFPADNLIPTGGQHIVVPVDGKLLLSWHGSDADNDIVSYDVYFGKDPSPAVYQQNVTEVKLAGVPVIAKTKYYWKVVTFDGAGNSSTSDIQQFSTN